jgi:hypothetical protein
MNRRIARLISNVGTKPVKPAVPPKVRPVVRFSKILRSLQRFRASVDYHSTYHAEKSGPRREARLHHLEFIMQRSIVLRRDKRRCRKCGAKQQQDVKGYHPDNLTVHHVYGWRRTDIDTLQTLCVACHICVPRGSLYWEWVENPRLDRSRIAAVRQKLLNAIDFPSRKPRRKETDAVTIFNLVDVFRNVLTKLGSTWNIGNEPDAFQPPVETVK